MVNELSVFEPLTFYCIIRICIHHHREVTQVEIGRRYESGADKENKLQEETGYLTHWTRNPFLQMSLIMLSRLLSQARF